MATAIDYTSRDFDTIKEALKTHLQVKFPKTWKDFYESSMGMAWLELVSYVFDILSFYLDQQANECFLPTAQDRLSVLNIGKMVGYRLRTATGASVVVKATIDSPQAFDVIIPAGTIVTTAKGVVFRTLENQLIPAGQTTANITFVQGEGQEEEFESDGSPFQKFRLSTPQVISGSVTVLVDGEEWDLVDSLVYGDEDSSIFTVEYDDDDYGYIQFGDGTNGKSPPNGAVITVTYRIGGGVVGNISTGEINQEILGQISGTLPVEDISVDLINEERGSGGEDRETIEHAKLWIPRWITSNGRAVTQEDFDTLANTFVDPVYGSPAFAKAKLRNEIPEYNTVDLYVWGRDSGGNITTASSGLKQAISDYFNNNAAGAIRVICTDVEVLDGSNIYIDVDVSIKVSSDLAVADVKAAVTSAISSKFSSAENTPGSPFRISLLYKAIQNVSGVDYSVLNRITASVKEFEIVGVGDGSTTEFSGALVINPGLEIVPRSCRIYHDADIEVLTDDGNGNILSPSLVQVGTIDYTTGEFEFTFGTAPTDGTQVTFEYREVIDYQRGSLEAIADGTTSRFRGSVSHAPVVPFTDSQKGIAFSDGSQVITDDGNGNLVGDVDPGGVNRIDYVTGSYDFTFLVAPSVGSEIRSTYRQLLKTASGDIPLDNNQLAVVGLTTIRTL